MQLKKIKIGKLHTENNIFCAPLAGYTNAPFRDMCRAFGAGLTFTEMVRSRMSARKGFATVAKRQNSFFTFRPITAV